MSRIAVVPGSFDPITLGHIDVIARAADLYDTLHVVVVHNPNKSALIPVEQRVLLIEKAVTAAGLRDNIVVSSWSEGLLVDFCSEVGAKVVIKGIRNQADVTYETPMALVNRNLAGIETLFMLPEPGHAYVSSSLVRQVASLGGDVRPYVPHVVSEYLDAHTR
jgi:pantetheine-phosphate adenylyltransferase